MALPRRNFIMKTSVSICLLLLAIFCLCNSCSSGSNDDNGDGGSDTDADTDTDTDTDSGQVPNAVLKSISPIDLADALPSKDFLLINVHVPYDGEIPGTDTHVDYQETEALMTYIGDDLGTKVVVYCKMNPMALTAGNELVDRGYYAVRYVDGGMSGWVDAGFELEYE
jgi:rhodanese-related sulfurtransferase